MNITGVILGLTNKNTSYPIIFEFQNNNIEFLVQVRPM